MSFTQTGTLKSTDYSLSYRMQWMPSCCGVGLLSGFVLTAPSAMGYPVISSTSPPEKEQQALADELNACYDKFKLQLSTNTGKVFNYAGGRTAKEYYGTDTGWPVDMPGICYAFLTGFQVAALDGIFDKAGWSKVKLNDEGHTSIENAVHGPAYITSYFKVFYGKTR